MTYKDSNSSFFSWEGTISRKDYAINMAISVISVTALYFTRFSALVSQQILYNILMFLVQFLQFVLIMSILSLIYRRIADFELKFSHKIQTILRYLFFILCIFPVVYIFLLSYFLNFMPIITSILGILSIFAALLGIIYAIIIGFIKS